MKKILFAGIFLCVCSLVSAQVPVTFHFKPDYKDFQKLRLVGSFNNWNNADDALLMSDTDGDGEYEVTVSLSTGTDHNYKFVMDADWGFAYTDPDNPNFNVNDNNNSVINIKNPYITYLLPRDVNSKGEKFIDNTAGGLPVRAIFAFKNENPVDINTLTVSIDGVPLSNPSQYYNTEKKEFRYQPSPALTTGEHTVTVSITSATGTDTRTTSFRRDPDYVAYQIPADFYFDQNNTSVTFQQAINGVSLVGTFNNWNDALNTMQDNDKDGLWETTAILTPGSHEYKFKLNKIFWLNDPDETKIAETADANSLVIAVPDSVPSMKLIQPSEGTVFDNDTSGITFQAVLRPGVKADSLVQNSISVKVDGVSNPFTFDKASSTVSSAISFAGSGRHIVEVSFQNNKGAAVSNSYSYGIYSGKTGVYFVDAQNDELYKYASGTDGKADILSVAVNENSTHDSLDFNIAMSDIGDNTRLGFIISNPNKNLINDPIGLDIKTIDWNNQGVFLSVAAPGSKYFNAGKENRLMSKSSPVTYSDVLINVNSDASQSNTFSFKISLALLDSILGSWSLTRDFYAFSYLVTNDGSGTPYEVTDADGGSSSSEDPDIYDAAFTRSAVWQHRMFSNYIPAGQPGGPRYVSLDGKGRGILALKAADISDSLATFGPTITFLTPAVSYWYDTLTVHGELSDTTIATVIANYNGVDQVLTVRSGRFSLKVTLKEGDNTFYVTAEDSRGYKTISKYLVLTYAPDTNPSASIDAAVNNREITLTANASSPSGTTFYYTWSADTKNPAAVTISPSNAKTAVLTLPQKDGEYYFNLRVRDAKNKTVNARVMVVSTPDSVFIPGINYHASWIDDAIVYEIYPRSFSDEGNFKGVADKIDYLKDLGINTIWFMPVQKGPTTHGYEITDYYGLEEDYGTEAEFKSMLTALKTNGFKVILDFVVNHTSVLHPFMQNVFQYKEYSPYANYYIWKGEPGASDYEFLFDWSSLPNLNHNNPDVRKYFIDVAKYWVSYYGIDGYRCDVAWGVQQRNSVFWTDWRSALKSIKPEVFLEAEANSSESVYYDRRFDSANDWDLRTKVINALNGSGTIQTLHEEAVRNYSTYARPFRFLENHDELRMSSLLDTKRSMLGHTLMFTLNGVPLIYSGGEVGELTRREMINWSDPDNMRPYFKKLIDLRKKYIHNPVITRLNNSESSNVYSYSSVSGNNTVLTVANFKDQAKDITVDLTGLSYDGSSTYFLTDLISGKVYPVSPSSRANFAISLETYQARVFYYGLDSVSVVSVDDNHAGVIPAEFKLYQNYPNPFNPTTTIKYQVKEAGKVMLKLYDILGAEVTTLVNEEKSPGTYQVEFNASSLSSGVYLYRMQAGDYVSVKKLILMK
jgi:glycosidase